MNQRIRGVFDQWLGPGGVKFILAGVGWAVAVHLGISNLQEQTNECRSIQKVQGERITELENHQERTEEILRETRTESRQHNAGAEKWKRRILRLEYLLKLTPSEDE